MQFYKIEVDEEVWQFLKMKAEPLEDTPNSVLRKLLFDSIKKGPELPAKTQALGDLPAFPHGTPQALAQTLEVIYATQKLGMSRQQATKMVARKRGFFPQTITDKYCRQLNLRASQFDRLLQKEGLDELQGILQGKFRGHGDVIRDFFNSIK